jgi:hypothetical protein
MSRLTLTLEESLRLYVTKRECQENERSVAEAQQRSGLSAEEAMDLAVRETAAARRQRTGRAEP